MRSFTVTIIDDWPRLKLIVNDGRRVTNEVSYYDVALSKFEPFVRNYLQKEVQQVIDIRKRSQS